jgi:ring-1,2-phenylacetyl-CoA epoxidase subunit PaaE
MSSSPATVPAARRADDDRHFHALTVHAVSPEAEDALVVSFEVPEELRDSYRFEPGQYLTLRRPGGDELRRAYSICAGPGEALRVGIRLVPGGAFSSWVHDSLQPGQVLEVMPPQGRFGAALVAATPAPRHLLALAGGSGITPILAIIKARLAQDDGGRVTLLYGNRSVASTMFKDELEDLKNRHLTRLALFPVFSREQMDSPLASGRLDGDRIATLLRLAGPVDQAYVCGPHAFNDEAERALLAAGLQAGQIHIERFGAPPAAPAAAAASTARRAAASAHITIVRDGVAREIDFLPGDSSVLAAATRAGLDAPFSCQSGVCATCRAKLLEGEVEMARNFALDAGEVAAGFVLTCQARPVTATLRLSFDER